MKVTYSDPDIREALETRYGADASTYPVNITNLAPDFIGGNYVETLSTATRAFAIFTTKNEGDRNAAYIMAEIPKGLSLEGITHFRIGRDPQNDAIRVMAYEDSYELPYPKPSQGRVFAKREAERAAGRIAGESNEPVVIDYTETSLGAKRILNGSVISSYGAEDDGVILVQSPNSKVFALLSNEGLPPNTAFVRATLDSTTSIRVDYYRDAIADHTAQQVQDQNELAALQELADRLEAGDHRIPHGYRAAADVAPSTPARETPKLAGRFRR